MLVVSSAYLWQVEVGDGGSLEDGREGWVDPIKEERVGASARARAVNRRV